jgi:hypothetical protein
MTRDELRAFYRVDGGKIAEVWGMAFHVLLLDQLR